MLKYKILQEDKDNPALSKIEKSGGTVEFTLQQIEDDLAYGKKKVTEIKAEQELADATMANIKHFHPEIAELKEEKLDAAFLYRKNLGISREAGRKLEEFWEAMTEMEQSKLDIAKQTGLTINKL